MGLRSVTTAPTCPIWRKSTGLIQRTAAELGGPDILVNNAVIRYFHSIEDFDPANWEHALAVNVSAPFHLIRLALPAMRAGGWGRIINISSVLGLGGRSGRADYITSKTALLGLTRAVAAETQDVEQITCNALCPGSILTPNTEIKIAELAEQEGLSPEAARQEYLTQRGRTADFIDPARVANLIVFLCQRRSVRHHRGRHADRQRPVRNLAGEHKAMTETIGFIGVGDMGGPMARRLLGAGYPLVVHDISAASLEPILAAGAEQAADAEDVASKAETVMTCLNSLNAIREVAAAAARGSKIRTFIDLSTTGPTFAREIREIFAGTPVSMLDCPVSGAMKGAEEGTLSLMISGAEPAYQAVRPMLEAIGKNLFYLGETPGGGQMMKLVNNYLSSMASVGTSEALVLGVKAGLDATDDARCHQCEHRTQQRIVGQNAGRCPETPFPHRRAHDDHQQGHFPVP